MHASAVTTPLWVVGYRGETGGGAGMADVLYVVLLIGIFVVLAGVLRGLERL
jgi:uncharacterized membrane protein YtjA (UPF0391 family)